MKIVTSEVCEGEPAMATTKKPAKSTAAKKAYDGFTEDERAAMKEHAAELKKSATRRGSKAGKAAEEANELLAKIAELDEPDRVMAEQIHAIVTAAAPELAPKLWYGMPAYNKDGKVVCFFQPAAKFKSRYATLGFNDAANLDDGAMWPTAFALTKLTAADEKRISALVKKAAS